MVAMRTKSRVVPYTTGLELGLAVCAHDRVVGRQEPTYNAVLRLGLALVALRRVGRL